MRKLIVLVSLLLSSVALPVWAEKPAPPQAAGMGQPSSMPEPPPQAYNDCKGKKEGDKVQVTLPDGAKIDMICHASPKGLFARPDGPMPQGKGGKPGQAGPLAQKGGQPGMQSNPPGQMGQPGQGGMMEPPPQAYQDCNGKKEGDKLTISLPSGEKLAAICTSSKKGLFARPEQSHRPGGMQKLPGGK